MSQLKPIVPDPLSRFGFGLISDVRCQASISWLIPALSVLAAYFMFFGQTAPLQLSIAVAFGIYFLSQYPEGRRNSSRLIQGFRRKKALPNEKQIFRSAFEHGAPMALAAADGRWLKVNRSFAETLGFSESELTARTISDITAPEERELHSEIEQLLTGGAARCQLEKRFLHKQGHTLRVSLDIAFVASTARQNGYLVFQLEDITERKETEGRLLRNALHDPLTDLPNRTLFLDHLKLAIERSKRHHEQSFAVLFIDLDNFKAINDRFGHLNGDELLIEVAGRLKACLRASDTCARLGGDEFTILLDDLNSREESIRIVQRIQNALARPFWLTSHEISISASIGITFGEGKETGECILHDADMAMYSAKTQGKARFELCERDGFEVNAPTIRSNDLRQAIERGELTLHYQPIVELATGELLGFEALARWIHPQQGIISPDEFIASAERGDEIVSVGRWVLKEACCQMRSWQKKYSSTRNLFVSVNVSAKQLTQTNLVADIDEALENSRLDRAALKLEITESAVMENVEESIAVLNGLRNAGIDLAIDDFGTGYSSLSYVHRFPATTLKIDRSFVNGLASTRNSLEIVRTIISLARGLNMQVVAEGIENKVQLDALRNLNCAAGQGFLFSKPIEGKAIEKIFGEADKRHSVVTFQSDQNQMQSVLTLSQIEITTASQPVFHGVPRANRSAA